mmetsp:Transcript_11200/g.17739  ORF Transcript_11200/g.17739 Transcript_11200/m.17739 type:complete len:91 (+) Transcript_11200:1-273(+)
MLNAEHSASNSCSFDCRDYAPCQRKMAIENENNPLYPLWEIDFSTPFHFLRGYHDCLFKDCEGNGGDRIVPCQKKSDSDIDSIDVKSLRA